MKVLIVVGGFIWVFTALVIYSLLVCRNLNKTNKEKIKEDEEQMRSLSCLRG